MKNNNKQQLKSDQALAVCTELYRGRYQEKEVGEQLGVQQLGAGKETGPFTSAGSQTPSKSADLQIKQGPAEKLQP